MADEFQTIDLGALDNVTGGRYTRGEDRLKPELIAAIKQLTEAVSAIGQSKIAAEQQKNGQFMQLFQQMAQARGGR